MILPPEAVKATQAPALTAADGHSGWGFIKDQYGKKRKLGLKSLESLSAEREQTYQSVFAPVNANLRSIAYGAYDDVATRADASRAGSLFDIGLGAADRERRAFGYAPLGAGAEKQASVRRKLAEIDAGNRKIMFDDAARESAQESLVDQYSQNMALANAVYSDVAGREASRRAQYDQASAQHKASLLNMGVSAASMAMMMM